MDRRPALTLAGDVVDTITIRLARIEALATAIHVGCNESVDAGKIICLASLAEDESQRAQAELKKWFDGLSGHHWSPKALEAWRFNSKLVGSEGERSC
jgi:hypothetical protein